MGFQERVAGYAARHLAGTNRTQVSRSSGFGYWIGRWAQHHTTDPAATPVNGFATIEYLSTTTCG